MLEGYKTNTRNISAVPYPFLDFVLKSLIDKQDLESQNLPQSFARKSRKVVVYQGLLNSLNMIFCVNMNVGTETGKCISRNICLGLAFISNPSYL